MMRVSVGRRERTSSRLESWYRRPERNESKLQSQDKFTVAAKDTGKRGEVLIPAPTIPPPPPGGVCIDLNGFAEAACFQNEEGMEEEEEEAAAAAPAP